MASLPASPKRKPGRLRRVLLFGLAGLCCLILADQLWIWTNRRISVGHDTTRITEPLAEDGLPDYLAALNRELARGVTAENNAAPLILQITGTAEGSAGWITFVRGKFALGDKPINMTPTFYDYVLWSLHEQAATSPSAELEAAMRDDFGELTYSHSEELRNEISGDLDKAATLPWSAGDYPRRAKWLELNAPALKLLEAACERPCFYMPVWTEAGKLADEKDIFLAGPFTPGATYYTQFGNMLLARAMLCFNGGDFAGYLHDVATSMALARLIGQIPGQFDYLKALRIQARTWRAVYSVLPRLSAEQARALLKLIAGVKPLPAPARLFDVVERYQILDMLLDARRNGFRGRLFNDAAFTVLPHIVPFHFEAGMKTANRIMDAYVAAGDLPTFAEHKAALKAINSEVDRFADDRGLSNIMHLHEYYLGRIILPSASRIFEVYRGSDVRKDLTIIALHLRIAKLRAGTYPDSLQTLASGDFVLPRDRFTEEPYIYRRIGEGFMLYSVGPNGKDDGGTDTTKGTDDIAVVTDQ